MKSIRILLVVVFAFAGITAASISTASATPAPPTGILQGLPPGFLKLPAVVPGSQTKAEGNHGWTTFTVPVQLSKPSADTVTVDYRTVYVFGAIRHQAIPFLDYQRTAGTVTFAPGETSKSVTVLVRGDRFPEFNNVFVVQFGRPHNARMGGFWGLGFGQILNDDHFCFFL